LRSERKMRERRAILRGSRWFGISLCLFLALACTFFPAPTVAPTPTSTPLPIPTSLPPTPTPTPTPAPTPHPIVGTFSETFQWSEGGVQDGITILWAYTSSGIAPGLFHNMAFGGSEAGKLLTVRLLKVESMAGTELETLPVLIFRSHMGEVPAGEVFDFAPGEPGKKPDPRLEQVQVDHPDLRTYQWRIEPGQYILFLSGQVQSGSPPEYIPGAVTYVVSIE
jgi:hypothetical protein